MAAHLPAGPPGRDPRWTVGENPLRHNVSDVSVFTVGAGAVATRGVLEESESGAGPETLISGVYIGAGPEQHLLEGPRWTRVDVDPPQAAQRFLDLYGGVLHRVETLGDGTFRSIRFACADRPGVLVMRVETTRELNPGAPVRRPGIESGVHTADIPIDAIAHDAETRCLRVESDACGAVVTAAAQRRTDSGLDRIMAVVADSAPGHGALSTVGHGDDPAVGRGDDSAAGHGACSVGEGGAARARRLLARAWDTGVDGLLAGHRAAWARRWATTGIELPDDPETEMAVRFALFQLWCNAGAHGENPVGARGLSGSGYSGHVFWDSDVFVLPALVSMDPDAGAAIVAYRVARLPAARERARAEGRRGARFPWESALDGTDVTPRSGFLGGIAVPILTGTREEHITADVAWAADHYAEWTGRPEFLETAARDLLVDTARCWASRVDEDSEGRAHISNIIGPDEYHESVDDNAYTNVMARWNLRRAARLQPRNSMEASEFAQWRHLADRIADQLSPDGRYQQFTGYFSLEPLLAAEVARPPLAADVLLGQQRVARSQLIKQPNVLMLHHLIPEELEPGSLSVNLDYYAPRTTHGSSLSPAIMAALLARAGRPDEALEMLRAALRLDLDDRTASTASGLHMATLGGVWQAVLSGFAGARVRDGVLHLHPQLPGAWRELGLTFRCLGRRVCLRITPRGIGVRTDGPIRMAIGTRSPVVVTGDMWCPLSEEEHGE
ncbi:glycosyl hydrolase family 65 protein [Nocardia crassostreae]|uniref:glycosyl hydrolase family 65 protein n=1 Tax=Nocardia crassostreae TaxID=53428 RepID=UPI00082AA166|nr:glycosyl hydrolase family 65 protein [Nocardia crassostreae]